ncbi:MAG: glycosyltransferase family 4 protein [Bacteroidia bacterium]
MIQVFHIINDYNKSSGGAEMLVQSIHNCMDDSNIESTLVGITKSDDVVPNAYSLNVPKLYSFKAFNTLRKYVKTLDSQSIVHAHLFPTVLYLGILKRLRLLKCPVVFTEHSTSNRRREMRFGKTLDTFIYKQIDYLVAISIGTKIELQKWLNKLNLDIEVIPNGIRLQYDEVLLRAEKDVVEIVSVGRLTKAKNYIKMLEAISLMPSDNIHYTIVGDGELRSEIERKIEELEIASKVSLVGYQKNVTEYLLKADVFLMASKWEGFGLSAVEAMNASLPLVLSNIPGLKEFVEEKGPAGVLVDPDSADQIAKSLSKFVASKELRINYGRHSFRASKSFSMNKTCLAYQDLYNRIKQENEVA